MLPLPKLIGEDRDAFCHFGHRVITYYRRGFGASSRRSVGYEFVTLATDLHVLLSRLRLRGWYWREPVR